MKFNHETAKGRHAAIIAGRTADPLKLYAPFPSDAQRPPLRPLGEFTYESEGLTRESDPNDPTQAAERAACISTLFDHVFDSRRTPFEVATYLRTRRRSVVERLRYAAEQLRRQDCLGAIMATFGPPVLPAPLAEDRTLLLRLLAARVSENMIARFAGISPEEVRFLGNYLGRCEGLPCSLLQFAFTAATKSFPGGRRDAIRLGLLTPRNDNPKTGTPERPHISGAQADDLLSDYIAGESFASIGIRIGRSAPEVSGILSHAAKRRDRTRKHVTPGLLRSEHRGEPAAWKHRFTALLAGPAPDLLRALKAPKSLVRSSPQNATLLISLPLIFRLDHMLWLARRLCAQPLPGQTASSRSRDLEPIASAYQVIGKSLKGMGHNAEMMSYELGLLGQGDDATGDELLKRRASFARLFADNLARTKESGRCGTNALLPTVFAFASLVDTSRTVGDMIERANDAASFARKLCTVLVGTASNVDEQVRLGSLVRHLLVPAIERALTPPASPTPTTPTTPTEPSTAPSATQEVSK